MRLSIRLRRRAGSPGVLACLGLQSTGGRRRLVQVTGVHDTLEGAITHCAGRAVHLACGGGGWGWVSGRPGRRQAGLTAGGHGCLDVSRKLTWERVGAPPQQNYLDTISFVLCATLLVNLALKLVGREFVRGRGYLSNPNFVMDSRFAPLASSAGNQDQTVCVHSPHSSFSNWFRRSAAPHVRTLQGVDELSPNRPARLRLAKVVSTET